MGNERLRHQLATAGLTATDLAVEVEVDPKTVERWITSDRIPHQRHRIRASEVLQAKESELWPKVNGNGGCPTRPQELLEVYANRGAVPTDLWRRLGSVSEQLDVLVYSGLFLTDNHPELPGQIAERARSGAQVRLLFGDPESEVVRLRGEDEGIGANLKARVQLALTYFSPLLGTEGIELRLHGEPLYNSIYRFDSEMLVNMHMAGSGAPQNPVMHLARVDGGQLFDKYRTSFEHVWEVACPLEAPSAV